MALTIKKEESLLGINNNLLSSKRKYPTSFLPFTWRGKINQQDKLTILYAAKKKDNQQILMIVLF